MTDAEGSLEVTDAGSGKPFLFVPGLSATMEDNLDAAAGLIGDFRVIAFDPRGHGRSSANHRSPRIRDLGNGP